MCLQAFRDVAVSCTWEEGESRLVMRAVCVLPAGVLLTGDMLLLLGADAELLLLSDGPEAVAAAGRLTEGLQQQEAAAAPSSAPSSGCEWRTQHSMLIVGHRTLADASSGTQPPGEVTLRHYHQLSLSVADDDPLRQSKESLLESCALDGPLFLTADVLCEVRVASLSHAGHRWQLCRCSGCKT